MPKSRLEIHTYKRELVHRKYVVEVDERELRHILSGLTREQNVMDVDEKDFLDYPDGRGEICTRVALMGAEEEMRRLQGIVGAELHRLGKCKQPVHACVVPPKLARPGTVHVPYVRTVP